MKRRTFLRSVVAAPAGAVLLDGPAGAQAPAPPQAPAPGATPPAPAAPAAEAVLDTVGADRVAAFTPRYLGPVRFATLRRLADLLFPALPPNPGALDAQAPEFLDNYLAVSDGDRQRLYRDGLDDLEQRAGARYRRAFAELAADEADAIVKPLFAVRGPAMSVVELGPFINRVHQDVRTVTMNSPQWAAAQAAAGLPAPRLLYWRNVDPTVPRQALAPWQAKTTQF